MPYSSFHDASFYEILDSEMAKHFALFLRCIASDQVETFSRDTRHCLALEYVLVSLSFFLRLNKKATVQDASNNIFRNNLPPTKQCLVLVKNISDRLDV